MYVCRCIYIYIYIYTYVYTYIHKQYINNNTHNNIIRRCYISMMAPLLSKIHTPTFRPHASYLGNCCSRIERRGWGKCEYVPHDTSPSQKLAQGCWGANASGEARLVFACSGQTGMAATGQQYRLRTRCYSEMSRGGCCRRRRRRQEGPWVPGC